jgi:hypothetical protein
MKKILQKALGADYFERSRDTAGVVKRKMIRILKRMAGPAKPPKAQGDYYAGIQIQHLHAASSDRCVSCGQPDYTLIEEGPHIARRCRTVGSGRDGSRAHLKPMRREKPLSLYELPTLLPFLTGRIAAKNTAPSPTTAVGCDHSQQLDLLTESLMAVKLSFDHHTCTDGATLRKEAGQ